MTVRRQYQTLDDIPEHLRRYFVRRGEQWVLDLTLLVLPDVPVLVVEPEDPA